MQRLVGLQRSLGASAPLSRSAAVPSMFGVSGRQFSDSSKKDGEEGTSNNSNSSSSRGGAGRGAGGDTGNTRTDQARGARYAFDSDRSTGSGGSPGAGADKGPPKKSLWARLRSEISDKGPAGQQNGQQNRRPNTGGRGGGGRGGGRGQGGRGGGGGGRGPSGPGGNSGGRGGYPGPGGNSGGGRGAGSYAGGDGDSGGRGNSGGRGARRSPNPRYGGRGGGPGGPPGPGGPGGRGRGNKNRRGGRRDDGMEGGGFRDNGGDGVPESIQSVLFDNDFMVDKARKGLNLRTENMDGVDKFLAYFYMESNKTEGGDVLDTIELKPHSRVNLPKARSLAELLRVMTPNIYTVDPSTNANAQTAHIIGEEVWAVLTDNNYYSDKDKEYMANMASKLAAYHLDDADAIAVEAAKSVKESRELDLYDGVDMIFHEEFRKGYQGMEHEKARRALVDFVPQDDYAQGDTDWQQQAVVDEDDL